MICNYINIQYNNRKAISGHEDRFSDSGYQEILFQAKSIGRDASEKIVGTRLKGTVLSVFQYALNILFDDGYFLTILDEKYQRIPFGISVSIAENFSFKYLIEVGESVYFLDNLLIIGNVKIKLDQESRSKEISVKIMSPDLSVAERNLLAVSGLVKTQNKTGGFFPLFRNIVPFSFTEASLDDNLDPICSYAATQMRLLHYHFIAENEIESMKSLENMFGLGVGLTPSGDDFLLGFFCLFLNLNETAFTPGFIDRITEKITYSCIGKTTLISEVYLYYGLKGQFSEVLSSFVKSLFIADSRKVKKHFQNLLDIGSSSGLDMILGCLFALKLNLIRTNLNTIR
jgi:hypothetical protein